MRVWMLGIIAGLGVSLVGAADASQICTLVSNAKTSTVLYKQGDCSTRVSPASTFKLAISLMGFDSGFLQDEYNPVLDYESGDPDWGGANWLQPTNPERWLKYSVVWYSQRVTHELGTVRVEHYARAFGFGNADLSGDPGESNGLDRAWISSSLKISPLEQLRFHERLANRELPVSQQAFDLTSRISLIDAHPEGWEIRGKTGTAFPRDANGVSDESRGYGWFVGIATKGNRTLAFVRLEQDQKANSVPAGIRARDTFLNEFPSLVQ